MSFAAKKKIVIGILVVTTMWPLVHHPLVRAIDANPWKWFGWSMYTTPSPRVRLFLFDLQNNQPLDVERLPPELAQHVHSALRKATERRTAYGKFARPDEFARVLFLAFPHLQGIRMTEERIVLDRSSATLVPVRVNAEPLVYIRSDFFE